MDEKRARVANWVLGAVIAAVGLLIALIAAGTWDPKPLGSEQPVEPVEEREGPVQVRFSESDWVAQVAPPFSVLMSTASADAHGGLMLRNGDDVLVIATDPVGFLSIWLESAGETDALYPWQTWPHIQAEENEIWLDVTVEQWTLRFNKELFYEGPPLLGQPEQAGVWVQDSTEIDVPAFTITKP